MFSADARFAGFISLTRKHPGAYAPGLYADACFGRLVKSCNRYLVMSVYKKGQFLDQT